VLSSPIFCAITPLTLARCCCCQSLSRALQGSSSAAYPAQAFGAAARVVPLSSSTAVVNLWEAGAIAHVSSLPSTIRVIHEPNGGHLLLLLCTPCSCSGLLHQLICLLRCGSGQAGVGTVGPVRDGMWAVAETCSSSLVLSLLLSAKTHQQALTGNTRAGRPGASIHLPCSSHAP
jgi:hypothetical protein